MASSTVICKVLVLTPSSATVVGLALKELVVLLGAPGWNVTAALLVTPANVAVIVTVCALVLASATEHSPEVLVLHVPALSVVLVPLALKVTD